MSSDLPTGWQRLPLGTVAYESKQRWTPGAEENLPYVGLEHIAQGSGVLLNVGQSTTVTSAKTKFLAGDVLFGKLRPNLRKVARPEFAGVCSTDILAIRPKNGTSAEFLFHVLSEDRAVNHAVKSSAGTKMPRTSWKLMSTLEVEMPPISEQRKIAEVLSSVGEAIRATEAVIAQTEKVKQATLKRLLTNGIGHSRFKKTEVGEIPESWELVTVGEIAKFTSGKLKSKRLLSYMSSETPVPVYGGNGVNGYTETASVFGPRVIIGRVGEYCGATYFVDQPVWITDNALYSQSISDRVRPKFLYHALLLSNVSRLRSATGQPLISQKPLHGLTISLPPMDEQDLVSSRMFGFEEGLHFAKEHLQSLIRVKAAVMSELLHGRKRVSVL